MTAATPTSVRFDLFGEVRPLAKAVGPGGYVPTRPLGGWIATYAQIADNGDLVPSRDREGHVFEAAGALGRIDWSDYLKKGKWNDTHDPVYVGVPTGLEFHDQTTELAKAHRKVGFWTEGHLFDRRDPRSWSMFTDYEPTAKDLDRSDHFWTIATMLKGLPRPLGFSAHGKMILSPCGERIIWARVEENAVCEMPQNPNAVAVPLRLAVTGGAAVTVRPEMVGKLPCDSCRCPPGARCKTLEKGAASIQGGQFPAPDEVVNAANLVGQSVVDRSRSASDVLVQLLCERFGCNADTATRWIRQWLANQNTRANPAQERA